MIKWQRHYERREEFNPVDYFGGAIVEELGKLKDPRLSGKPRRIYRNLDMFKDLNHLEGKTVNDLNEQDLISLIAAHKKYLELLLKEQQSNQRES